MQREAEPCIAQLSCCTFLTVPTAHLYITTWQLGDTETQSSTCEGNGAAAAAFKAKGFLSAVSD